jgi:hypothetical protein
MKIYEVTGKIRENPQQGMQQAKVVKQTGNELTVAPQADGQPTGTEVTVDLSKNPQAIQKDPQGNVTVNPSAPPEPTGGMNLQPGQDISIANAPGAMLPNQKPGQPQQQDQVTPENMDDVDQLEQEMINMKDSYYPSGYNDKYREKAMMRKAFQSITQDEKYFEGNDIIALAKRVANVPARAPNNQKTDILNLKKLAGL